MPDKAKVPSWKNERLGLIMIAASLAVIAFIITLLFINQQDARMTQIRSQGVSLTRLLSSMTPEQLLPISGHGGILQILQHSQDNPEFAYAAVIDTAGNILSEATANGTIVPVSVVPEEPVTWLGERTLTQAPDGREVLEFYAPLLKEGELAAHVRLGYFKPGFGFNQGQLSFIATLALPIFLLTPLFYFLIKREIKPLRKINQSMEGLLKDGNVKRVEIDASGDVGEFMKRFNQFVEMTSHRIKDMELSHNEMQTSTKVLSYKRARIEMVLQSLPEAVVVLDESGEISFANKKLTTLMGVKMDNVLGKRISELCSNTQILEFLSKYDGKPATGFSSETLEFSPGNAPEKTISIKAYPLFSPKEGEAVFGTLVVFRDISIESHAKQSRAEFVAHVAHELKTPMNVMAMYSESLMGDEASDEEFRIEAINVIHDEVERMSDLINNLLSLTKIEMGSMCIDKKRVKIRDLLEDAFENISRSGHGGKCKFAVDLPKDMSAIQVDKELLRIAINNLLTNAIKYNKPGGTVSLSAEDTDNSILIHVRDTGIGIANEDQAHIFDKFYRSDSNDVRQRTGHGLGLSLSQQIVFMHHGEISVESTPGVGTEFTIELHKGNESVGQVM